MKSQAKSENLLKKPLPHFGNFFFYDMEDID